MAGGKYFRITAQEFNELHCAMKRAFAILAERADRGCLSLGQLGDTERDSDIAALEAQWELDGP